MIDAISDFYRQDLPRQILHAQARAPKLMLEGGIPCQMLTFVSYLVSITNLNLDGRLLYSRRKAAGICKVTDRTLDRYLGQLETLGVIARRDRKRSPDGTYFGTAATWCSKWWHALFLAPTRSSVARSLDSTPALRPSSLQRTQEKDEESSLQRTQDYSVTPTPHCNTNAETLQAHCSELSSSLDSASHSELLPTTSQELVVRAASIDKLINGSELEVRPGDPAAKTIHATFASDCTGGSEVNKRLSFFNVEEKSESAKAPAFSEDSARANTKGMNLPGDLAQLLKPLMLSEKSIRMLMWAAKKTDFDGSKSRLQDAARYAMDRIRALGLLGDHAGRYLFKCLFSGEDFKSKLAMKTEQSEEDNVTRLANLFRDSLPDGEAVDCGGRSCTRNGYAVFIQGHGGDGVRTLSLEQMAVMATRCGLV